MTTVRWGILGTARHAAGSVIPAIKASDSGEVAAVASRSADRARAYADENGIPATHDSYEALLADPNVDAVYIPLPNSLHKEWAIKAAGAGKHTLCEKPLGLNAAEAEEMVAAFEGTGLAFAEAFQWRHHPQAQLMRELVQAGTVGDMRLIRAGFSFPLNRDGDIRRNPAVGGGSLYDVGCYPIAFTRYITGQEPVAVTAQAQWGEESGVDELLVATLTFADGVLAEIYSSFLLPLRRHYEVVGSTGALYAPATYNLKLERPGEIIQLGPDMEPTTTHVTATQDSYTLMVEDFNRAVLDDRAPLFPAEDAIGNMRVIDAVYRAAREGGTVEVVR